jgi:hypothetical protein
MHRNSHRLVRLSKASWRRGQSWWHAALVLMAAAWLVACNQWPDSATTEAVHKSVNDTWSTGPVDLRDSGESGDPDPGPGGDAEVAAVPEVCDGWDNDGDGEIDEGTAGQPCKLASGAWGATTCEHGVLGCEACSPGAQKTESCGCGTERVDICGPDGSWRFGVCDSCEQPIEACGECVPGDEVVRRCDTCVGESCGTNCAGALWRCDDACTWVQVEGCASLNAQCNSDQVINEPCGLCGSRRVTCDGCFWTKVPCANEGACVPGSERPVPCFDQECADGLGSSITCDAQCQWGPPTECAGCAIGTVEETIQACVPNHQCGSTINRIVCVAKTQDLICDGTKTVTIGELRAEQVGECVILCTPGQTSVGSCQLADGRAGTTTTTCGDDCKWGVASPCGAAAGSCIPDTQEVTTSNCGSGTCAGTRTLTATCRDDGSGWDSQWTTYTCPQCSEGETTSVGCTTALGECGTRPATCNASTCSWNAATGTCQKLPNACIPGTQETASRSCGANTCGKTYTVTRRCNSDGCGWNESEDRSSCPSCVPGTTETETCLTADNRCGTRQRICSNSACSWDSWGTCQPNAGACANGSVEYRSCSGVCGSTGSERWECTGCAWHKTAACDATPPCDPGEQENLGECYPGVPACGSRIKTCDASCQWVTTGCPPCG